MSKAILAYPNYLVTATVTATGTTTPEVDLANFDLVGIFVPSTFDGTTITLTAATATGGTFVAVSADNTASTSYTITTTASKYAPINPVVTQGLRFIKLVCGSSQTTTDTIFTLALRAKST
jgi:selenophosphate synthase